MAGGQMKTFLFAVGASCLVGGVVLGACAGQENSAPNGTSEADYTRQGGVLGQAPKLEFNVQQGGTIKQGHIDVFAIELREGDKITVVETISRGTLTPDFGLFAGGHSHVASQSHEALPKKLTKNYVATTGGKHFLGIAAYEGRGTGDYKVKVTCTGGPCAGQAFVRPLEESQKNECIQKARECALVKARPASGSGNASIASVRAAWASCLADTMLAGGESCKPACDEGDAQTTCKGIIQAVKYFASKPATCTAALNDCMSQCVDAGDHSDISEQICMLDGFNGTCDGYARANAACGGSEQPGSNEECHSLCRATSGAWMDDLDVICEESCD